MPSVSFRHMLWDGRKRGEIKPKDGILAPWAVWVSFEARKRAYGA
ncbi:MAG: hypothetical protein ACI30V_02920 [Muribaculaceae bacterium]